MKRFFRFSANPTTQTGLSLIELMIALLLGTLLTVGLVQVFTSNSQSFRHNEAAARSAESGRIAADILSRAIRNAGFFGCFPVNGITNSLDSTDGEYDEVRHGFVTLGVSATETGGYTERPGSSIAGTGFINVTGVRRPGAIVKLGADLTATNDIQLEDSDEDGVDDPGSLVVNDLAYITNCEMGDIFQISELTTSGNDITLKADDSAGADGNPGNDLSGNIPLACTSVGSCLSTVYAQGTEIFEPYSEAYFIGTAADGGRSLFMRQADGTDIELVAGVEDMSVRFGEGTVAAGVQFWRAASAVVNWDDVLAVEVSLLIASPNDNVMDSTQTYCFPGWEDCVTDTSKLTTAGDQRMYRVYTFSNTLRNPF
ncbi:PilW family protein [Marinobacter sp. F3R11]|uniref:PilW family protein n=1 Tax=Marinobacter sp. F3R11 TaxID=2267231 RepID=UPI000DE8D6DB|nr:PilW family protein [Marinobacter sp. F3R11]RBW48200.1 hypothetical protein DS878_15180 [Marinobacter sp. F3R11]